MTARSRRLVLALQALRRRVADERGYTLVELLTALLILSIVLTALTSLFVSASNAQVDMNNRFRAQQEARLALDKLRRDVHCASGVSPTGPATSVTLTLPVNAYGQATCFTGSGAISWCTVGSGQRWALWRKPGTSCTAAGGVQVADYLTTPNLFDYVPQSVASLAKLRVTLPVDTKPTSAPGAYTLRDDIVLRNTRRAVP